MYHEHPIRILKYSVKNLWLLIFPLLRGIRAFTLDVDKLYNWIKGSWFDIMVLGAIIFFGLIRWYFSRITLTEDAVVHTDGVIAKVCTSIPYSKLSAVTVERSFYLIPFGAMRIYCDTSAGIFKSSDMKIMVNKAVCGEIMTKIPNINIKESINYKQKPKLIAVLLFSVFFSSSFSGAVYVAAFFFKGGDLAKDIISVSFDKITAKTSEISQFVIRNIPAAAIGIGTFFLASWLLSFIVNFLRYYGFAIKYDKNYIDIVCGTFTRRRYKITVKQINFVDLRQNLIMKICGFLTINISCAGYGSSNDQMPVAFPIKRKKNLGDGFEKFWLCSGAKNEFRPKIIDLWTYIWSPVIISACIYIAARFVPELFPRFSDLSFFALIMAEIPSVWMILVKFAAAATSGIAVYEDKIKIKYSRGFGFHTVIADKDRIVKMSITQTPMQKAVNKCTVGFYLNGEQSQRHYVKALSCDDADNIAILLGYDPIMIKNKNLFL